MSETDTRTALRTLVDLENDLLILSNDELIEEGRGTGTQKTAGLADRLESLPDHSYEERSRIRNSLTHDLTMIRHADMVHDILRTLVGVTQK